MEAIDLRPRCPPIYNQGDLGSCTAQAICGCVQFEEIRQNTPFQGVPSRLFLYYNERALEGSVSSDSGAAIRDGIKTLVKTGVCPETMWPYIVEKFAIQPPQSCYNAAIKHKAVEYSRLYQTASNLEACLVDGNPFVFGIQVYSSFEDESVARTGIVPVPDTAKEACLGGHAIVAVGFNKKKGVFICRNSWGPDWGQKGYFTLPYDYVLSPSLASDFWVIKQVL